MNAIAETPATKSNSFFLARAASMAVLRLACLVDGAFETGSAVFVGVGLFCVFRAWPMLFVM
jgi:hypothetical protein